MLTQNAFVLMEEKRGNLLPRCCICNEVPDEGICGGIRIRRNFLCQKCEGAIVKLTEGSANYDEIMERIIALFRQLD